MKDRYGYSDDNEFEDSLHSSEAPYTSSLISGAAPITKILVVVTSAIWVLQILLSRFADFHLVAYLGLVPEKVTQNFELWRLVTMMLLHDQGTAFHILFNMFALWVFGREVERSLGSWRFLRFYVLAGIVASLLYVIVNLIGARFSVAIGASGAIMGILVLFACMYPNAPVLAFLFIPMKAKHLVLLLVALDFLWFVVLHDNGVANSAHLGGAAFGFLYFRYSFRVQKWLGGWEARRERKSRDREREVRQEVDDLLSKISREGMPALTSRERRFLKNASRRFGDRQA